MRHLRFLIIVIGIFSTRLSVAQEPSAPGLVYVEPPAVMKTEVEGEYRLLPYLERRGRWGGTISIGYSSYEPVYYTSDFVQMGADEVYSSPDLPMIELKFTLKRNYSFGSLGVEVGAGFYQNVSDVDEAIVSSELNLTPIYVGGILALDTLTPEPRFVPYVTGGFYTMLYNESESTRTFHGNTQVAPYVTAGLNIQVDRLDPISARRAYEDSGILTSYIYLQVSKIFEASDAQDPDFEDDLSWGVGMRVEL